MDGVLSTHRPSDRHRVVGSKFIFKKIFPISASSHYKKYNGS